MKNGIKVDELRQEKDKLEGDRTTLNERLQAINAERERIIQQMTMIAGALQTLKSNDITVALYTDSKYVIQGINEWIDAWKVKDWKTANKKPVKNVDLWKQLDALNQKFSVNWHWVKGHSDDPGNDMADLLANQAMDEIS